MIATQKRIVRGYASLYATDEYSTAKLDAKRVREIRAKHMTQGNTYESLSEEYGVSVSCIKRIVTRLTWRDV